MENKGKLFLIPTVIAEDATDSIPVSVLESLKLITHFLAEEPRTARRFLSSLKIYQSIEPLQFYTLNKDKKDAELLEFFLLFFSGQTMEFLSKPVSPDFLDPEPLPLIFPLQK